MTIVVSYQLSAYRTFKWYYLKHVLVYRRGEFPILPSYNRFVELMARLHAEPLQEKSKQDANALPLCRTQSIVNGLVLWLQAEHFIGKLFGDKGYISEKPTELLATQNIAKVV